MIKKGKFMTKTEFAMLNGKQEEMELVIPIHGIEIMEDGEIMKAYTRHGAAIYYTFSTMDDENMCVLPKNNKISFLQDQEPSPETIRKIKLWAKDAQRLDKEFLKKVMNDVRSFNVGESDYAEHAIQPWDIWREYHLDPWTADIIKRALRKKKVEGKTMKESRKLDLQKIKHICDELISQIDEGYEF